MIHCLFCPRIIKKDSKTGCCSNHYLKSKKYIEYHKQYIKDYNKKNREKINKYHRDYYAENEDFRERAKERVRKWKMK
jgi:hypothetical protein